MEGRECRRLLNSRVAIAGELCRALGRDPNAPIDDGRLWQEFIPAAHDVLRRALYQVGAEPALIREFDGFDPAGGLRRRP